MGAPAPRGRVILAAAVATQASVSALYQGLPAVGPSLQTTFDLDPAGVGLLLGGVGLGSALSVIGWGRLLDRIGDRMVGMAGLLGTAGCLALSVVAVAARSYPLMVLALICAGAFVSAATVAITKSMARAFAGTPRFGLAFGIRQAAVPLGGVTAAVILPIVAVRVSLGLALSLLVAATGIAAVVVMRVVRREEPTASIADRPPAPWRRIWRMLAAAGAYGFTQIGVVALVTLFLFNARGWTPVSAGVAYAGVMAAVVVVRVVIGHLADRYVARRVAMFRLVGWAVAALLLLAAVFTAQPVSVALLLIAAIASMTWNPVMFTVSVAVVPPERVGVTQGALTAIIFLAGGLAPILTAAVVTAYSWSVAWTLLAGISVFGALIMSSVTATPARDGGQSR